MMDLLVRSLPEQFIRDVARTNAALDRQRHRLRELEQLYALTLRDNRRLRAENETLLKQVGDLQLEKVMCEHHLDKVMQELRAENQDLLREVVDLRQKRIVYERELIRLAQGTGASIPTSTDVPPGRKTCSRCGHLEFGRLVRCPACNNAGKWWR